MTDLVFLESNKKMPGLSLPVRTTIVKLEKARVMISPGSSLSAEQLKSVGEITDLVAPSLLHCGGMQLAMQVFPKARVWGPKGAPQIKPEILWTHELSENIWLYNSELKLIEVHGIPRLNECVFVHKKSKSLIVTDLFFNLTEAKGIGAWIFLHMFGTYRRFALSRLFAKSVTNKEAFKVSAQQILEEDFENIVVGHGHIKKGGPEIVLRAFQERGFKV